uniref:Uncharacterized protein n=1 Tax=Medicago truncatula TaxID=3880 RepID=B7FG67_MEDTR|nr:unknown [Medicago truncatula]
MVAFLMTLFTRNTSLGSESSQPACRAGRWFIRLISLFRFDVYSLLY